MWTLLAPTVEWPAHQNRQQPVLLAKVAPEVAPLVITEAEEG